MGKLAIVTGASGWLGSRFIETLMKESAPYEAIRIIAEPSSASSAPSPALEVRRADVRSAQSVRACFDNARGATVFHIAGIIHPHRTVKEFFEINTNGTQNVLEAAITGGARRFIYVSSNSPAGTNLSRSQLMDEQTECRPYMSYGRSKKLAEELVTRASAAGQIETVIIRPPWFYGPGQPARQSLFFSMIRHGRMPVVGDGANLRSMAYIDNICDALLLCDRVGGAGGQTYWIADRRPYPMKEVIDTIERLLESEFGLSVAHKRVHLPNMTSEIAYACDWLLQTFGLYHQKIHVLSEMNKDIACSIAKAEQELGYSPRIELEEGMRRSIAWALGEGHAI